MTDEHKNIDDIIVEDAAKAAFVKAQSVYRADHDHFPLKQTWETTSDRVRDGWRGIAHAALEAADTPPLGTQPEPRNSGRLFGRKTTLAMSDAPDRIAELEAENAKLRESVRGEDWENAAHNLLWLRHREGLFSRLQAEAKRESAERLKKASEG